MQGLKIRLLLNISVLQSKAALLLCVPPFFLFLYLTLPPLEGSFTAKIWRVLSEASEGPAFAFMLLNCVTGIIVASSKLGSEKRGQELESQGQLELIVEKEAVEEEVVEQLVVDVPISTLSASLEDGYGNGDGAAEAVTVPSNLYPETQSKEGNEKADGVVESVVEPSHEKVDEVVEPSLHLRTPLTNAPDLLKKRKERFLRRGQSLNASFSVNKHGQIQLFPLVKDKASLVRSRPARYERKQDSQVMVHPNKPTSNNLKSKKALTARHSPDLRASTYHERPIPQTNLAPGQAAQNPAPAARPEEHPSMDEVWAAITASKKRGNSRLQEERRSRKPRPRAVEKPQSVAAVAGMPIQANAAVLATPAAASHTPLAPVAAGINPPKVGKASPKSTPKASVAGRAEKCVKDGEVEGNGGDQVDKLNRRAEEFIGRFNYQMRLQREESLQRKGLCRPRDVLNDVSRHGVHLRPPRGLLVG